MHPELLAAMTDPELSDAAKRLFAHVYAYTNGRLETVIDLDEALALLRVSEGSLRRTRRELFEAGYMRSRVRSGDLECEIEGRHERAPTARFDDTNAHLVRAGAEDERAPTARNAHLVRAAEGEKRAVGARCVPRGERENGENLPPTPPHKELVNTTTTKAHYRRRRPGVQGGTDQDRKVALLEHLGLTQNQIVDAERLSFADVVRHVAAWQMASRRGEFYGIGALVTRFVDEWPVPPMPSAEALQDGVLERFVNEADLDAWGVERDRDPLDAYDAPPEYEGIIKH